MNETLYTLIAEGRFKKELSFNKGKVKIVLQDPEENNINESEIKGIGNYNWITIYRYVSKIKNGSRTLYSKDENVSGSIVSLKKHFASGILFNFVLRKINNFIVESEKSVEKCLDGENQENFSEQPGDMP